MFFLDWPRQRKVLLGGVSVLLIYQLLFLFGALSLLRPFTYLFRNQSKEGFLVEHDVAYYPVAQ